MPKRTHILGENRLAKTHFFEKLVFQKRFLNEPKHLLWKKKGVWQNLFKGSASGYSTEPSKKVLLSEGSAENYQNSFRYLIQKGSVTKGFCRKLTEPFMIPDKMVQSNTMDAVFKRFYVKSILFRIKSSCTSAETYYKKKLSYLKHTYLFKSVKQFFHHSKYQNRHFFSFNYITHLRNVCLPLRPT